MFIKKALEKWKDKICEKTYENYEKNIPSVPAFYHPLLSNDDPKYDNIKAIINDIISTTNDILTETDDDLSVVDDILPKTDDNPCESNESVIKDTEDKIRISILGDTYEFQLIEKNILGMVPGSSNGMIIECNDDGSNFTWYSFSAFGEEKYRRVKGHEQALMDGINLFLKKSGYSEEFLITSIHTPDNYKEQCGYTEGEREYFMDCI